MQTIDAHHHIWRSATHVDVTRFASVTIWCDASTSPSGPQRSA